MRITPFGLCLAVSLSGPAVSGPYFNPPPEVADEVREIVRNYERNFNEARRNLIDMFDNWESDPEAATYSLGMAVEFLSDAQTTLNDLPETHGIHLNVSGENLLREDQIEAYDEAERILRTQLDRDMPINYSDMVSTTAAMTERFQRTLIEIEITSDSDVWDQTRRAIKAEVEMLLIGSTFSIMAQSARQGND